MLGNHRLNTFLHSDHRPNLLLDVSAGLSLGALPGLERFDQAVKPLLRLVSGLVSSPGQIGKLGPMTREDAGLLVRMDWNNTLRGSDFVLPTTNPQRIPVISVEDALDLGAEGMVTTFLLGYDEEVEAACLLSIVGTALRGKEMGIPLVVDVQTTGLRVSVPGKAIELGASYALEGGADVIVVPYPQPASLKTLGKMLSVPWLVKPTCLKNAKAESTAALDMGASGIWLDHKLFQYPEPAVLLQELNDVLHAQVQPRFEVKS